jgi:hypothetical protein
MAEVRREAATEVTGEKGISPAREREREDVRRKNGG